MGSKGLTQSGCIGQEALGMTTVKSGGLWVETMGGCITQGQDTKIYFMKRKSMPVKADVPSF